GARRSCASHHQKTDASEMTVGRAFQKVVWTGLARRAGEFVLDKDEAVSLHCAITHVTPHPESSGQPREGRSPVDAQLELRVLRRLRTAARYPDPHLLLLRDRGTTAALGHHALPPG